MFLVLYVWHCKLDNLAKGTGRRTIVDLNIIEHYFVKKRRGHDNKLISRNEHAVLNNFHYSH